MAMGTVFPILCLLMIFFFNVSFENFHMYDIDSFWQTEKSNRPVNQIEEVLGQP